MQQLPPNRESIDAVGDITLEHDVFPCTMNVERCSASSPLHCFGSGRELYRTTPSSTVWNLLEDEGEMRFGVMEKASGAMYIFTVQ